MKDNTGIAIIVLAIVILILGIPFALNQYSDYNDRISIPAEITATPEPPANPNIFDKNWCRDEGTFKHCYRFFPDHSYQYGFDGINDGHAQVEMPGQWKQISKNQYEIPEPHQIFSYLDGKLFTGLTPSEGPFIPDDQGLLRTR